MRRWWIFAAATALVTACATDSGPPQPGAIGPAGPPAASRLVEPAPAPEPQTPTDQCGAEAHRWLIGKPKTDIPVPTDLSNRRVTCTACPMTMDYSPRRLNILFDAETGIVKEVRCG